MRGQIPLNAVRSRHRVGKELYGLFEAFIRLGAAEAQKSLAGRTKTFASQTGDAEMIVGTFQQEHGQAVRKDAQALTDGGDVGENVKRAGGHQDFHIFHAPKFFNQ